MNLDDLARIGEFLGGLAILLSLIYLIVELKRQSALAKAAATVEWGRLFHTVNFELASNPETSKLLSRSFRPGASVDDFSEEEYERFVYLARGSYIAFRMVFDLQDKGGIPKDLYHAQMSASRSFLEIPVWRTWWDTDGKAALGLDYVRELENWKVEEDYSVLDVFKSDSSNDA